VLTALVLVPLLGGGVALAGPPATPQITDVTARWGMYTWDDGSTWCTLIADAALDPGFTKGSPVSARSYVHYMWVGEGGGTFQWFNYWTLKLSRGDTNVHTYMGFYGGDQGYYVVDRVRYELISVRGQVLSSIEVSTTNTCENGPSS
jgi:hypothetical protein